MGAEKQVTKGGRMKPRVYLVSCVATGLTKIGYSKSPDSRIRALQTANPSRLLYWGSIEATREDERWYHRFFEPEHVRGEWFALDIAHINAILRGWV